MSTKPERVFFISRKYLIFHIKSFSEDKVQHLNNIFESENKQLKNHAVITCEFVKKKKNSGTALPWTYFTTLWILRVASLNLGDINK